MNVWGSWASNMTSLLWRHEFVSRQHRKLDRWEPSAIESSPWLTAVPGWEWFRRVTKKRNSLEFAWQTTSGPSQQEPHHQRQRRANKLSVRIAIHSSIHLINSHRPFISATNLSQQKALEAVTLSPTTDKYNTIQYNNNNNNINNHDNVYGAVIMT